jgi:hypothetical protein
MASGHVNRIYRPNTWQHRPSLRREDFSCQPGAVHTWHETDMPTALRDVRSQGQSGKHLLALSFSGFDPAADISKHFIRSRSLFQPYQCAHPSGYYDVFLGGP